MPILHEETLMDEDLVNFTKEQMEKKLAAARRKGRYGWWNVNLCSNEDLVSLLHEHIQKKNEDCFLDIAILSMMLHYRHDKGWK